jgi:Glycosyl transferase family 2
LKRSGVSGEVVIADNGSTDGSIEIARSRGARVVSVPAKGYGSALLGGIAAARGSYVIMGDADDSYDFSALDDFVRELRGGADLVMGNRFRGGIKPGAMPVHHRYLGNPVLSGLGRLFFGSASNDFHCGLRGFSKAAIDSLNLRTSGMEFASEMVVKASLHGLRITEVPTVLYPDGRSRPPHLRSWRDGWRHLRFLLLYSPRWLFLYPGVLAASLGATIMAALTPGPLKFGPVTFDVNTLQYSSLMILLGVQCVIFSIFTKIFGANTGLLPVDSRLLRFQRIVTLERGLVVGGLLTFAGLLGTLAALRIWGAASFGRLDTSLVTRVAIPSVTAMAVGIEIAFSSFFLSLLQIGRVESPPFKKNV